MILIYKIFYEEELKLDYTNKKEKQLIFLILLQILTFIAYYFKV